ncbi:MAG: hypothetical protein Q7U91_16760 [Sideroxyarcus sp.]|nr:hypothetical protein [Sideroxyarcus sp.]
MSGFVGQGYGEWTGRKIPRTPHSTDKGIRISRSRKTAVIAGVAQTKKGAVRYAEVMRHAVALSATFFNSERMLTQYITKAYFK